MPELPEVEINARNLRRWAVGRVITGAAAPATRVLRPAEPRRFTRGLVGRRIGEIERTGKHLLIALPGGATAAPLALYSHLGMTGKWVRLRPREPAPSHLRATFELDDGTTVAYRDPRLFGRLWRVEVGRLAELPELAGLGPDPLACPLDGALLRERLGTTGRAIHAVLLDQSVIAGAGNIYAQEALFRIGLDPRAPSTGLDLPTLDRLAATLVAVLREALDRDDSEELTYVEEGAENPFEIYGRAGSPCPRCQGPLVRLVVGGRGVTSCPRCQPRRRARSPASRRPARRP